MPPATARTASRRACVVIDVGNTSTSIGRWDGRRVTAVSAVRGGLSASPDDVARALDRAGARTAGAAALASVVPSVNAHWSWYLRRLYGLKLEILSHETPLPIAVDYPHPRQIGADRLCDAAGAAARHGFPVAVADFGTALTFDVVDARGAYVGGLIAPGLPVMGGYLHEKTAQLPAIDLRAGSPSWGDSTVHAMQLGARVAYRGMVREMADFIRRRTGERTVFCATGGYAAWALEESGIPCSVEPDLTLFGLGVIWSGAHPRRK
ncbi:MAG: type III pantothenate kinase [Kiritimatiellae bacterium]|nr:type III pantothenate kinase [Kiritimatiellia bacterium]